MSRDKAGRSTTGGYAATQEQAPGTAVPEASAGTGPAAGPGSDPYTSGPDTTAPGPGPDSGRGPGPTATRPAVDPPLGKPQRTRLSGLWIALTSGAVVLLVLLIFILENGQKVDISFFGAHGHLPLGVALLMAAIFGVLMVVIPGAGRMIQLRMLAKRHRKQVAGLPPTPVEPAPGTQVGAGTTDPALAPGGYDSSADQSAAPRSGS